MVFGLPFLAPQEVAVILPDKESGMSPVISQIWEPGRVCLTQNFEDEFEAQALKLKEDELGLVFIFNETK